MELSQDFSRFRAGLSLFGGSEPLRLPTGQVRRTVAAEWNANEDDRSGQGRKGGGRGSPHSIPDRKIVGRWVSGTVENNCIKKAVSFRISLADNAAFNRDRARYKV